MSLHFIVLVMLERIRQTIDESISSIRYGDFLRLDNRSKGMFDLLREDLADLLSLDSIFELVKDEEHVFLMSH